MSSKPQKPKSSKEPPAGTSTTKKQSAGKPKADASQIIRLPQWSQGHEKAWLRFQNQMRNGEFGPELNEIVLLKDPKERSLRLAEFMLSHDIDLYEAAPWSQLIPDSNGALGWSALDPCQVVHEALKILGSSKSDWYKTPPDQTTYEMLFLMLYPVHICISPLASQNDVTDYVAKKWGIIRRVLDCYSEEDTTRKSRVTARDQFIWEHREVRSSDLADMVCEKFPGEEMTYSYVNIIKQRLRKRHSNK